MRRRFFLIVLVVFCIITTVSAFGEEKERTTYYEKYADMLKLMGMFNGTAKGFELDREPTRIEASVIIVRLLGKENEAKEKNYEHPFLDVPQWADPYVGYLYQNKIISGVSETKYAPDDLINVQQFITLLLRVLDYDDKNGDFQWDKSLEKALEIDLISEYFAYNHTQDTYSFIRDDVVLLIINTLNTKLKNSDSTLMEKLIDEDVLTLEQALDSGFYRKAIRIENKGVIIGYKNSSIPEIIKVQDRYNWFNDEETNNNANFITRLIVCGDNLKEYEILFQDDNGFDKETIVGKSITFTGDLIFNLYEFGDKTKYIDIDTYNIEDLQDNTDYEPIIYKGKFIPTGHIYDIGGQEGFTFITDNGEKYNALMGTHILIDKAQIIDGTIAPEAYVNYNLMNYTNVDVWVKGYKKKNSTLLYVTEFGKNFILDENSGQWIEKSDFEDGINLAYVKLVKEIENNDDNIVFEGTYTTTSSFDEEYIELIFDKNKFGNKVPNEAFVGKTIDVYFSPDTDLLSTPKIEVEDWYYEGETYKYTSSCYGTLSKVLNDNSEYIEYELDNIESPIKAVRFYKSNFIGVDFYSLIGKTGYFEGVYADNSLNIIRVMNWIEM